MDGWQTFLNPPPELDALQQAEWMAGTQLLLALLKTLGLLVVGWLLACCVAYYGQTLWRRFK